MIAKKVNNKNFILVDRGILKFKNKKIIEIHPQIKLQGNVRIMI